MPHFKHNNAIIHEKAQIGEDTRIWAFCNVQEGAVIGSGCNICDGCFIEKGAVIGNNVTIKNHVSVFDGITLEDNVFIGANVGFINDRNPRSRNPDWKLEKTTIGRGATIGTNATVMCGLEIGEYAFVAAGSVVTKYIPPYTLAIGHPAQMKGFVCQCGQKLNETYQCGCTKTYSLTEEGLELND